MHFCSKAAPAALGGCGGLGQLWEALAELWEALGLLGLSYSALPVNPGAPCTPLLKAAASLLLLSVLGLLLAFCLVEGCLGRISLLS